MDEKKFPFHFYLLIFVFKWDFGGISFKICFFYSSNTLLKYLQNF
jgi:hypothetical protein